MTSIVYIVIISDEMNESSSIHSVYSSEDLAATTVQELESRLNDMIVYYEEHEVVNA